MDYASLDALWDIDRSPAQFSQLPEDDFLALLHKQFAHPDSTDHSVNPQSTQSHPQSPPSDDSSPSPPSVPDAASRRQSLHVRPNDPEDAPLKRKASSDDMEPGPSSKNQHTDDPAKKPQPSRRKSTGNPQQDESRLLKRKEQNRAAQRAFRERKEKHVKDLEDKVAALEAKNEATEAENTNLRDLLSRLQQENLVLKQAQFTFSVPKPVPMPAPAPNPTVQGPSFSFFGTPSFPPPSAPSQTPSKSSAFGTDIDWSSLTTFDPSVLSVLDEPSEMPMQTDAAPSPFGQYALPQSYKTIANNPLFMSFADELPSASSNTTSPPNSFDQFPFNFTSSPNSWTSTTQSPPFSQNNGQADFLPPSHGLDELFGGSFMGNQGPIDLSALVGATSVSPVSHANGVKPPTASQQPMTISSPPSNSNNSSPSTSTSQSPFSWTTISQPGESPPSGSESTPSGPNASAYRPVVVSRADVAKRIAADGPSPFTEPNSCLRKTSDASSGDMISCQGSKFPPTKESPNNIEVLKAWKCITQNPHFKDVDINELCAEFAKKARCDGTKVVLEPESVHQLFEKFKKLPESIPTQQAPDRLSS